MQKVEVQQIVPGGEYEVFARCADYQRWPEWLNVHSVVLEEIGEETIGVGCVRIVSIAGLHIREEIVEYARPDRIGYVLLSGLPVHDYRGTMTFEPCFGGTRVQWTAEFEPNVPGTGALLRRMTHRLFADGLEELARQFNAHRHAA